MNMPNQKEKPPDYGWISTPQESSAKSIKFVEFLSNISGVPFGIDFVDKTTLPGIPGDVIAFIGMPGHCKTTLLTTHARNAANRIYQRQLKTKPEKESIVIYATWEQTLETQKIHFLSGTMDGVKFSLGDVIRNRPGAVEEYKRRTVQYTHKQPIYIAGYSFETKSLSNPMFISHLHRDMVKMCTDYGYAVEAIYFDYLQIMKTEGNYKYKNLQIAKAIEDSKDLAVSAKCPVYIGVQAKREVASKADKYPGIADTFYSSELGHVIDKGFGLLKYSKVAQIGQLLDVTLRGVDYPTRVTDKLFGMHKFKERLNDGDMRYIFDFDVPEYKLSSNPDFAASEVLFNGNR